MGATVSTLTNLELVALAIFIPSGLNKIVSPSLLMELWPTLPAWLWRPTGVYEMTGCLLAFLAPPPLGMVGFGMLYSFMGGVMSSLVYIPDDKGRTHASGKGKLGLAGLGPLVPATGSTALVYSLEHYTKGPLIPLFYGILGFGIGAWLYHEEPNTRKATPKNPMGHQEMDSHPHL